MRTGDFELTFDELRVVARFAVESADRALPFFQEADPDDPRPRAAIEAAWAFASGAARTRLQRVTALDAHRAAKDVADEAAQHAARAAGDAAAAAYLHPLAKATQVRHILGAPASAARAAELSAGDDPKVMRHRRSIHLLSGRRLTERPTGLEIKPARCACPASALRGLSATQVRRRCRRNTASRVPPSREQTP